jgi:hypothetical protein
MLKRLRQLAGETWRTALWSEPWCIGVRRRGTEEALPAQMDGFAWLDPPAGHFYADPFPFEDGARGYVFFEDFDDSSHGRIAWAALDEHGRPGAARPALERPYHLSYPFVFRWRGEPYLLPETHRNRAIELYRAEAFPARWRLAATLLDSVNAADATLLEHEGRVWMFVTLASARGSLDEELHLFHAQTPLGPFRAHPANPVVVGLSGTRPAGTIERTAEGLIRPAQDCAERYGGAIVLKRIDALTPEHYAETAVGRIEPAVPAVLGTHTLARSEHYEAVDLRLRRARLSGRLARPRQAGAWLRSSRLAAVEPSGRLYSPP